MTTTTYYEQRAREFFDRTVSLPMDSIRDRFLAQLPPGARILDIGCGSGRDTLAFRQAGYQAEAFDGSAALVTLARQHTGVHVRHLQFSELAWDGRFEGMWACASLVHLPPGELHDALLRLRDLAHEQTVLYASFKDGNGPFIDRAGRYFNRYDAPAAEAVLARAGWEMSESWVTSHLQDPSTQWTNLLARAC